MRKSKILLFFTVLALFIATPVFGDVLKVGSTGVAVKQLQTKLISLGYLNSSATGYFGNQTKSAVMKFQAKNGLKQDGIAGNQTLNALAKVGTSSTTSVSRGSSSSYTIKDVQTVLKSLGLYTGKIDGIAGSKTKEALKKFQKNNGLVADGILGTKTAQKLFATQQSAATVANRGDADRKEVTYNSASDTKYGELLDWWTEVSEIFYRGAEAQVIDLWTGKSFNVMRTYGSRHADCETLTAEDTKIMKEIYGGSWSWNRRPVIVVTGGRRIAGSMAGMPHAGLDSKPKNVTVSGRSGGYGKGTNLDTIKGNNMDGHFDIHFLNSRTHGTNKVNEAHQKAVKQAAGLL
ncbi:peptidoglycan-binding domain-containing protein [Lutispora thermophila]|uniref:Peptidoglycan-binding (PGRP) domain of peptidoglycan hydrolases-containing protein n=1 Tax=Lutispora thermophila DSM 19022 TaxID=1122184 RepID=A0A1M6AVY1_9FIRM|nr:peptidoglycan-binding protein [Lutispora thermophila]SHI40393.1 Peptidoglycan-binding (PGRP) domain of peptidoglycan hydrolases-containing protein [Lutispora thermophila DSM 19022]